MKEIQFGPDEEFCRAAKIRAPKPPVIKLGDKAKTKTISVLNALNSNGIQLKVIASREKWIEWEEIFLSTGSLGLLDISPHISRPKRETLSILETYAKLYPRQFAEEFYDLYISEANIKNKDHSLNMLPRGGSPYGWTKEEAFKVRVTVLELFICLKHWLRQPLPNWPEPMDRFRVHLDQFMDKKKNSEIIDATKHLLKEHFNISIVADEKNFYDSFLLGRTSPDKHGISLNLMKEHCKHFGYIPRLRYERDLKKLSK